MHQKENFSDLKISVSKNLSITWGKLTFVTYGRILFDGIPLRSYIKKNKEISIIHTISSISGAGGVAIIDGENKKIHAACTSHPSKSMLIALIDQKITFEVSFKSLIEKMNSSFRFNLSMLSEYLHNSALCCSGDIYHEIRVIQAGETFTFDFSLNILNRGYTLTQKSESSIEIELNHLCDNSWHLFDGRELGLFYSGGFDSTLLLHSLRSKEINFTAYYKYVEGGVFDYDIEFAKQKCDKIGIKFHAIKEKLDFNFSSYLITDYTLPHEVPICNSYSECGRISQGMNESGIQYISGHGGDAVFSQNTAGHALKDAYIDKGAFFFIKKMIQLSKLKGVTLYNIIDYCMNCEKVKEFTGYPGKDEILANIYDSLGQAIKMNNHLSNNIIYPILTDDLIKAFVSSPAYAHFDKTHDRILARAFAFKKYNDADLLIKRKNSSSSILFHILDKKHNEIIKMTTERGILEVMKVSESDFSHRVSRLAKVMYNPHDYLLVHKAYQLAVFMEVNNLYI